MKCHEAARLIDKYINNQLDSKASDSYITHIKNCSDCRTDLELARRLSAERSGLEGRARFKAPDGFTSSVMSEIYGLKAERKPVSAGDSPKLTFRPQTWKPVYSRLGLSLILTGAIIVFSMLAPLTGSYPGAISGRIQSDVEYSNQSGVLSVLTDINSGITGVFRSINNSVSNIKGGTDNGM
jgi:hypothetical protein